MSSGRPGRGRGRPSRNAHILQETGGGLDGTTLLHQITHPALYPDVLWHSSGRTRSASFAETDPAVIVKTELDAVGSTATTSSSEPTASATVPLQTMKRTAIVAYTIAKQEEMMQALQSQQQQYSALANAHGSKRQKILEELLGPNLASDSRYYPDELLVAGTTSKKTKAKTMTGARSTTAAATVPDVTASLDELAQQEESRGVITADAVTSSTAPSKAGDADDPEEDEELDQDEIVEEYEEELDYNRDYYASDADSDGDGGGGEAVF